MLRNSGENPSENPQLSFEHEVKAQQEQIWMQIMQGDDTNRDQLDPRYHRIAEALVQSRETPIKHHLDINEQHLVVEDLERHGDFVQGQDYHAELEHVPRIVLEEDFTSLTDDEAEFLSEFKGVIFCNHIRNLTPKQAASLQKFKGVLFVQGLAADRNSFLEIEGRTFEKLEDEVGDLLAQRAYKTFVPITLNQAFYERIQYFRKVRSTVDIEKPE